MMVKGTAMFRLSNKLVQVSFRDSSNIIINSESRLVIYENKREELMRCPLTDILKSGNNEMIEKFNEAKEILNQAPVFTKKQSRSNVLVLIDRCTRNYFNLR